MNKLNVIGIIIACLVTSICAQGEDRHNGIVSGTEGGTSASRSSTTNCIKNCSGNSQCINSCNRTSIIAGAVTGSVCGTMIIVISICFFFKSDKWIKCTGCCFHKYQKIRRTNNVVEPGNMSLEEYKIKKNNLIFKINQTTSNSGFQFIHKSTTYTVFAEAKIKKEEDQFLTQISLNGNDHYGMWNAKGYILCRNGGELFMWFYKIYKDRKKARQTGKLCHLIYESTNISDKEIKGIWFYLGFENSQKYSGEWKIQGDKSKPINSSQTNFHIQV